MASLYEFWLLDDTGRRLMLLNDFTFFSYSRSVRGYGTFEIGLPYKPFSERISPNFKVDWRVDVWRSPGIGYPMRREQTYLLRMYRIYTRNDGVQIITFYGRDPKDLLNRRYIIQAAGTQWARKTDLADDMMKAIVREQMLFGNALDPDGVLDTTRAFPTGEFLVQGDLGLGPSISQNFSDRNVLDTLKDIQNATAQLALDEVSGYQKIYFDVVPIEIAGLVKEMQAAAVPTGPLFKEAGLTTLAQISSIRNAELGFRFETYAGLRGIDRTANQVFSQENNNLQYPYYSKSHLEEMNTIIVKGFGRGDSREYDIIADADRVNLSRWARYEGFVDASSEPDQTKLANEGEAMLYKRRPDDELSVTFLNIPGGPDSPRSLYGIDWDMGDLLPVEYAGKRFNVECEIVHVALSEEGKENITGMNMMNESTEV